MKRMLFCAYDHDDNLVAIFLDQDDAEFFIGGTDMYYEKQIVNDFYFNS